VRPEGRLHESDAVMADSGHSRPPDTLGDDLERFWADVLSADPPRIRQAMAEHHEIERRAVIDHLRRMAHERGWTDGQQQRARAALTVLEPSTNDHSDP
jgi:hypothetical protein